MHREHMHDLTSSFSLGLAASLGIAAVTALWLSPCQADPARSATTDPSAARSAGPGVVDPELVPPTNLAELRAQGPAALEALLVRYRRALQLSWIDPGWDRAIDAVAGQRHAAWSGLYWYTDLALAQQEARRLHKPILALRMLGDLRDDLSCANSRLFRATLYANQEVAAFLRANFVLHWSSERAVPTVTIDFGDGRKLVRTTTGNSAHYVLDDDGAVLDVLPGLYAPSVFRAELTRSLALAERVRGTTDETRLRTTVAYHADAIAATDRAWQQVQGAQYIHGSPFLLGSTALARAQRATMSKRIVEVADLQAISAMQPGEVPDDAAAWSAIGQKIWNITDRGARPQPGNVPAPMVLDDQSRSLVRGLHNMGALPRPATPDELDTMVARLEQHIVADTALNQFRLRPAIHRRIVEHGETRFAALNGWIYADVFATPSSDPWLGLLPRTDFTGLPGDGVVMP
jgi:hypothetical protein